MQAKKTNPEKTKNPEMFTLDSTYRIGNRSFIVEPVFKEESSQTLPSPSRSGHLSFSQEVEYG